MYVQLDPNISTLHSCNSAIIQQVTRLVIIQFSPNRHQVSVTSALKQTKASRISLQDHHQLLQLIYPFLLQPSSKHKYQAAPLSQTHPYSDSSNLQQQLMLHVSGSPSRASSSSSSQTKLLSQSLALGMYPLRNITIPYVPQRKLHCQQIMGHSSYRQTSHRPSDSALSHCL